MKLSQPTHILRAAATLVLSLLFLSLNQCKDKPSGAEEAKTETAKPKIGVLVVSHGSHSANWRKMLVDMEKDASKEVLEAPGIEGVKSAFMEYNEPSIATQLKAFDKEGFTDVIIVPVLLTVSSHSFDDIPVIAGQRKSVSTEEQLKQEKIDIYKPNARVHMTPLLDFPEVMDLNIVRRVKAMSKDSANEGVVLVGYGSEPYNKEWTELMEHLAGTIKKETGIDAVSHSWCGHLVHYDKTPTEKAIKEVLGKKQTALVVPVLVAVDEYFQGEIIGGAIDNVGQEGRIQYRHDSILPDNNVRQWIIDISRDFAGKINAGETTQAPKAG